MNLMLVSQAINFIFPVYTIERVLLLFPGKIFIYSTWYNMKMVLKLINMNV